MGFRIELIGNLSFITGVMEGNCVLFLLRLGDISDFVLDSPDFRYDSYRDN